MSTPRTRTLAHMKHLVAATALTVGCSRDEPPVIKKEDEPKAFKKKTDPSAEPKQEADAAPSAVPTPTGYAVVDPLPPPACPGVAASITASATVNAAGEIEMKLSAPTYPTSSFDKPASGTPGPSVLSAVGGTVIGSSYPAGGLVVKIAPEPKSSAVYVYVNASCGKKHERVFAYIDLTKASAGKVPVTLSDYF